MIFFDIDGVVRNLCGVHSSDRMEWSTNIGDDSLCSHIDKNLQELVASPETPYCKIVREYGIKFGLTFISHQHPSWRGPTCEWLNNHFGDISCVNVIFTAEGGDSKLQFLKPWDLIVEDYPMFSDNSQVIMIDYPYNTQGKLLGGFPMVRIRNPEELRKILMF